MGGIEGGQLRDTSILVPQRAGPLKIDKICMDHCRPGKSCKSSSSGKLRILQCPQNSLICVKRTKRNMCIECWCDMMESSNLDCLSLIQRLSTSICILNPQISILLPQISFSKPQFSIVNSSSSILTWMYRIFHYFFY